MNSVKNLTRSFRTNFDMNIIHRKRVSGAPILSAVELFDFCDRFGALLPVPTQTRIRKNFIDTRQKTPLLAAGMNAAPKPLNTRVPNTICLARLKVLVRRLRNRMYARTVRNLSLWRCAIGRPVKQEAPLLVVGRKSRT